MSDKVDEMKQTIRRSLGMEFVRLEDDFDETRDLRKKLTEKLVASAAVVKLVDMADDGSFATTREDTSAGIQLMNTALKALDATEKASVSAISMKLRHSEQEAASAAAHQDRITVVLQATRAGQIREQQFEPAALEHKLTEMFDGEIQSFETKTNPNDLED